MVIVFIEAVGLLVFTMFPMRFEPPLGCQLFIEAEGLLVITIVSVRSGPRARRPLKLVVGSSRLFETTVFGISAHPPGIFVVAVR